MYVTIHGVLKGAAARWQMTFSSSVCDWLGQSFIESDIPWNGMDMQLGG